MRMLAGMILLGLPAGLAAQTPDATAQGDVSVTIYNNNLALVQDKRQLTLKSGPQREEFADVSASIRPETVTLQTDDATIVEQNFDYDLLTPEKLLDKSVGQTVTLVRTNPATGVETSQSAQVLANNGGTIVRTGDRIQVVGQYDTRSIVLASLPPNLRARPTLSVTLDAGRSGSRPATLSYLSTGLGWKADYVALFDETAGKIDVQGWITLNNSSGTTFSNAKTLLVAGAVGQDQDQQQQRYPVRIAQPSGNSPGTESADRERLGDFYVYPIEGRTTIANAQQKQVSFLDVNGAPASKGYFFRNAWLGRQDDPVSVDSVLRFSTSRSGGLGDALPAGTVRVYMRDARGSPQFIGENGIDHTPMGSSLALKTGEAFDVKVQPIVDKRDRITTDEWERSGRYRITDSRDGTRIVTVDSSITLWRTNMRYVITNAKPTPVKVEIVQSGLDNYWRDTRVPIESVPGTQRSADERTWLVDVPANGSTTLSVSFDTRY